jgi:outer membrane protein assembly factor BamB
MHFNLGGGGQSPWTGSIILSGILLYNRYYAGTEKNVVALDLRTGEELWVKNATSVGFGQHFKFEAGNQYAAFDYWWETSGTNWTASDPLTGRIIYQMTDVPSGTTVYGPNGEILRYTISLTGGYMSLWNSTAVVAAGLGGGWSPYGRTYNATRSASGAQAYPWNVSIPKGLPGSVRAIYHNDMVLGYYRGGTVLTRVEAGITLDNPPFYAWAISLKPESRGQLLWNKTYQLPPGNLTYTFGGASQEERIFTMWCKETRKISAYNLDSGNFMWEQADSQNYLDIFGARRSIMYGKVYSYGYAGIVYTLDAQTGKLLWTYEAKDPFNEILWSNNWPLKLCFITDDKLYFTHGEHSPNSPLPRGAPFFALNATTGEEIFRIDGAFRGAEWGQNPIIGDSVIASWNSYDNQIYGIGKGPSSTTVSTNANGVEVGERLIIQGRVTDVSPGLKDTGITARFPQGVPAIADKDMSAWMKYVYLQFDKPTDIEGVDVSIDAIDPNGNLVNLGKTTSDQDGFYDLVWQAPDVPGEYKIIASFAGSKAYYASQCQTAAFVAELATANPTTSPLKEASMVDQYFVPAVAGIAVLIVACFAVTLLLLRKRP